MNDDTVRFLNWWWSNVPEGSFLEIRIKEVQTNKIEQFWFTDIASTTKFLQTSQFEGKHVWYGLQPRSKRGGSNEDVLQITFKAPDLDSKLSDSANGSPEEDYTDIKRWAKYPCYYLLKDQGFAFCIVGSGNGVQLIVKRAAPLDNTVENMAMSRAETMKLGKDVLEIVSQPRLECDEVTDVARVLRLPGFLNPKGSRIAELWEIENPVKNEEPIFQHFAPVGLINALKRQVISTGRYYYFIHLLGIMATMGMPKVAAEATLREFNVKQCTPLAPEYYITNAMSDYEDWLKNNAKLRGINGETSKPELIVQTQSALMAAQDVPIDWLIDGVLAQDALSIVGGYTDSYKTWIMLYLAHCVASGQPFLDIFNTKKAGVLYIDEENGIAVVQRRMKKLGFPLLDNLYLTDTLGVKLDNKQWLDEIGKFLIGHPDVRLVIADTYRNVVSYNENDSQVVNAFINDLKQFRKTYHVATPFLHHFRKRSNGVRSAIDSDDQENFRGSGNFVDSGETNIVISREVANSNVLRIKCTKLRQAEKFKTQVIRIQDVDGKMIFQRLKEEESEETEVQECEKHILEWFMGHEDEDVKKVEIVKGISEHHHTDKTIGRALASLLKAKLLYHPEDAKGEERKGYYRRGEQSDLYESMG